MVLPRVKTDYRSLGVLWAETVKNTNLDGIDFALKKVKKENI